MSEMANATSNNQIVLHYIASAVAASVVAASKPAVSGDEWIYVTADRISRETPLTRPEVVESINSLIASDAIEDRLREPSGYSWDFRVLWEGIPKSGLPEAEKESLRHLLQLSGVLNANELRALFAQGQQQADYEAKLDAEALEQDKEV